MFRPPIRYLQTEIISRHVPEDTEGIRQQDQDTVRTKLRESSDRMKETVLGEAADCTFLQILLTLIEKSREA